VKEEAGADPRGRGDARTEAAAGGVPEHEEGVLPRSDREQRGEEREATDVERH